MPCFGSHFWKRRIAPLMVVTYHYVKFYVSIIIHLEVININVWNFNFPIGFYRFEPLKIWLWPPLPQSWKHYDHLETYIYNSTKFHEILSSSSWDLPWTSSCATERKKEELTKIYPLLPTFVQPISITKALLIVPTKNERDPPLFTGKLLIKFQNILRNTTQVIILHRVKILFSVISSPITLER